MKRKVMAMLAAWVLTSSISVFAQDNVQKEEARHNETQQNSIGKDEMEHDAMGTDEMKRKAARRHRWRQVFRPAETFPPFKLLT
jgi:pentapeptide MXKDX repeat protein